MPNHVCWMCKANSHHVLIGEARLLTPEAIASDELACGAFRCNACNGISVGIATISRDKHHDLQPQFQALLDKAFVWRPEVGETQEYPDVPDHIARAATEAYECHAVGHRRAAILLARSVIEATAKAKGIEKGNLQSKIDDLGKNGHIRPLIAEAAHGVRLLGNEMAHGDFVQPVTNEECAQVIHLMGEILNEVFQQPTKVRAMTQAVEARKGQSD